MVSLGNDHCSWILHTVKEGSKQGLPSQIRDHKGNAQVYVGGVTGLFWGALPGECDLGSGAEKGDRHMQARGG